MSLRVTSGIWVRALNVWLERELAEGRLAVTSVVAEPSGIVHQKIDQYYGGIPVWGAQLVRHIRDGHPYALNGSYYPDLSVDLTPGLAENQAVAVGANDLADPESFLKEKVELVVLPRQDGDALAYRFVLGKRGSAEMYFIDARTGAILLRHTNLWTEATVGSGTGVHDDTKKLSTDSYSGSYRSYDRMRPAAIKTYDFLGAYTAWYYYTYSDSNLSKDGDNSWTGSTQKPVVDGHAYAGWIDDYFYMIHDRKGYNDANQTVKMMVNFDQWGIANAFWDGYDESINFYSGDNVNFTYMTGGLDVVAHEYSHGVTAHTSNLYYYEFSGALNEAFSDIMGTCVEFYHQVEGVGFLKADWLCAEDALKVYNENSCFRRLDKPYLLKTLGTFPYPDHWSLRYTGASDNKGVHINSSIANHWFYLISEGGTNRTSSLAVSKIGRAKAEKIVYRAWTVYLGKYSNFWDARWASIQAARDLYGAGSQEETAVNEGWRAVGID